MELLRRALPRSCCFQLLRTARHCVVHFRLYCPPGFRGIAASRSMRDPTVPLLAGGNGDSAAPVINADGRFVLF
jgi:hypothetical protein